LLTFCTQYSGLQAITAPLLIYEYTFYSSPLHTHYGSQDSLVVSWQRIYESHCHLKSHMKYSLHRIIPFLPLFYHRQFQTHDSIQFLCSQHISSQAGVSKPNSILFCSYQLRNSSLHGPRRKHSFSIVRKACLQCRRIATKVTQRLFAYALPRECVYRIVA
jgi:hypothetical protein